MKSNANRWLKLFPYGIAFIFIICAIYLSFEVIQTRNQVEKHVAEISNYSRVSTEIRNLSKNFQENNLSINKATLNDLIVQVENHAKTQEDEKIKESLLESINYFQRCIATLENPQMVEDHFKVVEQNLVDAQIVIQQSVVEIRKKLAALSNYLNTLWNISTILIFIACGGFVIAISFMNRFFNQQSKYKALLNSTKRQKVKLQALFDGSVDPIFVEDYSGNILDVNEAACKFHQTTKEDLISKNIYDLLPPEKHDIVKREFEGFISGKINYIESYGYQNQKAIPISIKVSKVKFDNTDALLLHIQDRTKKEKIERALFESEKRYRDIIENARDFIIVFNQNGTLQYINQKAIDELFIINPEQINFFDLIPKEKLLQTKELLESVSENKKLDSIQVQLIAGNGKLLHTDANFSINKEKGETQIRGIFRDISEKVETEKKLIKSEQKYRELVEFSDALILNYKLNGEIISVNKSIEHLLGYKEIEVIHKRMFDLLPTESNIDFKKEMAKLYFQEQSQGVVTILNKKGDIRYWLFKNLLKISSEEAPTVVSIAQDITERYHAEQEVKAARKKAEEAKEAKDRFFANISHEIRTPLNSIIGFTDLLSQEKLTKEQEESIKAISYSSKHLRTIVNDLLDLSKIEAQKLTLENIQFPVKKLKETCLNLFEPEANKKELDLTFEISKNVPEELTGDPTRVNQIIINLVSNAIKFTEKGFIKVSIDSVDNKLLIEVEDSGIGMSKEEQEKVFESYSQANIEVTRKFGGTGLGLTITRYLIDLMHGTIKLESAKDKGTTFIITLDIDTSQKSLSESISTKEKAQFDKQSISEKHILIAEDDLMNQKYIQKIMDELPVNYKIVSNGNEAEKSIELKKWDIIILDINMPKKNGDEVLQFLRKDLKLKTPVVLLTANNLEIKEKDTLQNTNTFFLMKPYTKDELFNTFQQILSTPIFDFSLTKDFKDDKSFLKSLSDAFLSEAPKKIDELNDALKEKDIARINQIGHSAKSVFGMFGISSWQYDAMLLENTSDIKQAEEIIKRFTNNWPGLKKEFNSALGNIL